MENLAEFRKDLSGIVTRIRAALSMMEKNMMEKKGKEAGAPSEEIAALLLDLKKNIEAGWVENITAINAAVGKLSEARLEGAARDAVSKIADRVLMSEFDEALSVVEEFAGQMGKTHYSELKQKT
jgi:hypothetical protein